MMRNLTGCLWIVAATTLVACGGATDGNNENAANTGSTFQKATTIELSSESPRMSVDQTMPLTATVLDQDGEEMTGVALDWSSSDDSVIEVTDQGIAIANKLGTATITASVDEVSGSIELEVAPPAVGTIEITPAEPDPVVIGRSLRLSVTLYDSQRAPIEGMRTVEFQSSDESILTVSSEGLVRGIAEGSATVTVTSEEAEASVDIEVIPPQVMDVELDQGIVEVVPGDTVTLTGTYVWAGGIAPDEEPSITWSVDDPDVATIDESTGELTAVSEGKTTVIATVDGKSFDFVDAVQVIFDFGGVSTGGSHACGMVRDAIFCWGSNDEGQLGHAGDGPGRVESDLNFKAVSAGGAHTCAIAEDDTVHCWGAADQSQMPGSGGPVPVAMDDTMKFGSIAAGDAHTCGITLEGELYCWGAGGDGRLGSGNQMMSDTPVMVGDYMTVAVGAAHTCALTADNEAHCWGANDAGQLGLQNQDGPVLSPTPVAGYAFKNIVAGATHTCGTTLAGATACWGANDAGQVGDTTNDQQLSPVLIAPNTMARLSAGPMHTCGLTSAGEARCWGEGADGRLGTGSDADALEPTDVDTSQTFFTIDAGDDFTCAIATSGEAYCWGAGADGQLGAGSSGSSTPIEVEGLIP